MPLPPPGLRRRSRAWPVAALGMACACSVSEGVGSVDASLDADSGLHTTTFVGIDAGSPPDAGSGADALALRTSARLALLSPIGYGVDFCVAVNGNAGMYTEPLLVIPGNTNDAGADAKDDGRRGEGDGAASSTGSSGASGESSGATAGSTRSSGGSSRSSGATGGASGSSRGSSASSSQHRADGGERDGPRDAPRDATRAKDATVEGSGDDAGRDGPDGHHDGAIADARDAATNARDAATDARDATTNARDAALDVADAAPPPVGGVLFGHVSRYVTLPVAGTFSVRVVRGGSPTCAESLLEQRVTLDPGKLSTLVVQQVPASTPADASSGRDGATARGSLADAGLSLGIFVLTDEPQAFSSVARARFFNAMTASDAGAPPALRVAATGTTTSGPLVVPLALDVPVDRPSAQNPSAPAIDSLGYWAADFPALESTTAIDLVVSPLVDAGAATAVDGSVMPGWTFSTMGSVSLLSLDLQNGTTHTGFIVGNAGAATLVWCEDSVVSDGGVVLIPSCTVLSPE